MHSYVTLPYGHNHLQVPFSVILLEGQFVCTKFCDLCADEVQGRQFLISDSYITNVCGYKILHFWATLQ